MGEPSDSYNVRSLAEILREHGLESEQGTRPGRRRRGPDDAPTGRSAPVDLNGRPAAGTPRPAPGAPSPRPGTPGRPAAPAPGVRPVTARAQSAAAHAPAAGRSPGRGEQPRQPDANRNGAPPVRTGSSSAAAPAPVPSWTPAHDRPRGSGLGDLAASGPVARVEPTATPAQQGRRHTDAPARVADGPPSSPAAPAAAAPTPAPATGPAVAGPSTAAIPALQPSSGPTTGERRAGAHRTGPQPAVPGADADAAGGPQGALAWVRFVGELVVALAVGIGLYFAFTFLWELMPYAALVAAPLVVTGLVAGVAAWRKRQGQGPLAVPLLAGLVLAGTMLAIAPAAGLLAGS
ncbi:hypothetical protein [Modestobacter roseus]|uniref:Uncharacterized protein n=1 Tax=Modestobacter roseus TaxID=1181884 RepID=A0A562ITV5_9ACTN|nr:hypothetical protein [Modestobacter roseus]MQA33091.1 hypothetical protein [Modestobacter roseus]TWH74451.1 hypothetical protein JD78_02990 [Modestobacter roseus]